MSLITTTIAQAAQANGVPPALALAQASKESSLDPTVVSPKGAAGLFQLMPGTAEQYGVTNPFDPAQSANGGTAYLSDLYSQYGSWELALAAYDWGPGNLDKALAAHGDNWFEYAPAETQDYVTSILANSGMQFSSSVAANIAPPSLSAGAADTSGDSLTVSPLAPEDGTPSTDNSWMWAAVGLGALALVWATA